MTTCIESFSDTFFKDALTEHFLIVAKLALDEHSTTEIIFHTVSNNIGSTQFIKEFERIVGQMVSGYLKYPKNELIASVFSMILKDYCIKRQTNVKKKLKHIQFIFMDELLQCATQDIADTIESVKNNLYASNQDIAQSLQVLAVNIESKNTEDLLLLNLKYVIEILKNKHPKVRKVMMHKSIRNDIFSKIMPIRDRSIFQSSFEND